MECESARGRGLRFEDEMLTPRRRRNTGSSAKRTPSSAAKETEPQPEPEPEPEIEAAAQELAAARAVTEVSLAEATLAREQAAAAVIRASYRSHDRRRKQAEREAIREELQAEREHAKEEQASLELRLRVAEETLETGVSKGVAATEDMQQQLARGDGKYLVA